MKINRLVLFISCFSSLTAALAAAEPATRPAEPRHYDGVHFYPPATPLVTCDPYFSIWSPSDNLTDAGTVHWTGKPHRIVTLIRVDGKSYRVLGLTSTGVPAFDQKSVAVFPTRTVYSLEGAGVGLT